MTEQIAIALALLALLALLIALGMFCHGLLARIQMQRCKNAVPHATARQSIQGKLPG